MKTCTDFPGECCDVCHDPANSLYDLQVETLQREHVLLCCFKSRSLGCGRNSGAPSKRKILFSPETIAEMHRLYASGDYTQARLAKKFKVGVPLLKTALKGAVKPRKYKKVGGRYVQLR
jgi:hypothetical protein